MVGFGLATGGKDGGLPTGATVKGGLEALAEATGGISSTTAAEGETIGPAETAGSIALAADTSGLATVTSRSCEGPRRKAQAITAAMTIAAPTPSAGTRGDRRATDVSMPSASDVGPEAAALSCELEPTDTRDCEVAPDSAGAGRGEGGTEAVTRGTWNEALDRSPRGRTSRPIRSTDTCA